MDLTDGDSQDWMGRGYVEAASTEGSDVSITGDPGPLPDAVDDVLADLLVDHDVARYPGGAVVAWFPSGEVTDAVVRDPAEVEADPYPFDDV